MNYTRYAHCTYPLPDEDIMNDRSSTEDNSKTNDNRGHYGWSLVEVKEGK